ncbi:MAG: CdaR family protein [Proteocatella sp.]
MKKKLKNNFKIKLFSFAFAFIMWIYVMSEVDPIVIRSFETVPVESVINIDEIRDNGLTFAYGQNFNVKIDFRAKRSTLNEYIRNGIKPKGEIYDPKEGTNTMTILLETPREIEYSIVPEYIDVVLEKSVVSLKNIDMEIEGNLQHGYIIGSLTPNKTKLYVEGPKSQVEKIDKLLAKVKLENQNTDFSSKVNLIPVDSKGHVVEGVTVRDANIIVDINVEKTKTVPVKLNFVDSQNKPVNNTSFESEKSTVDIQGEEELVNSIEYVSTKPIKISKFNSIDGLSYELEMVEGIKISESSIKIKPIEEKVSEYTISIPKENVTFTGDYKSEDIKQNLPDEIEVKLFAGKEYAEKVNTQNIKLYIDNKQQLEEYKMLYKVEFPIVNIKVTPDVINLPKSD